MVMKVQ